MIYSHSEALLRHHHAQGILYGRCKAIEKSRGGKKPFLILATLFPIPIRIKTRLSPESGEVDKSLFYIYTQQPTSVPGPACRMEKNSPASGESEKGIISYLILSMLAQVSIDQMPFPPPFSRPSIY